MKISDMTNDQATEAMIRLSGPFSNICNDEEALKLIDRVKDMEHTNVVTAIGKIIPDFVMFGLKKHRNDIYEIIGALTNTPISKVGSMNVKDTINELRNSYDDILASFFT